MGGRKDVTGAAIEVVGYAVVGIAVIMGTPAIEVVSGGAPAMTVAGTVAGTLEVDMIPVEYCN